MEQSRWALEQGRVPIVWHDTASESGHFSLLLGRRDSLLRLSLSPEGAMATDEFLSAGFAPANKLARIVWAVLSSGQHYRAVQDPVAA